jgi:DNA-binding IclR family transcriptional regulator
VDELGLVKSLEQGAKSADELTRATGTHAPSVHRLLRALASVGVLTEQDGQFSLGPLAWLADGLYGPGRCRRPAACIAGQSTNRHRRSRLI